MNQFPVTGIADKINVLKTEAYFRERQARGEMAGFDAWVAASPEAEPMPGDELPDARICTGG